MIIINKGYNLNDSDRFSTNERNYSLYTSLNYIPNPSAYENICEDEAPYRLQRYFFDSYFELRNTLLNYFEWSVDNMNFYPLDPIEMRIQDDDGTDKFLTLYDCFNIYEIIIKPKERLLDELYANYNVPQHVRVSSARNKEIPSYPYKYLMQWFCNPMNNIQVLARLTEDEVSFYTVYGKGLRG